MGIRHGLYHFLRISCPLSPALPSIFEKQGLTTRTLPECGRQIYRGVFYGKYLTSPSVHLRIVHHLGLGHHDLGSTVIFLFEEDRSLDPSEKAFQLKLGYCVTDVVDSGIVINKPVSTWCLRITEMDGLALLRQGDGRFQRLGFFGLDEERTQWFDDATVERIVIL